MLITKEDRLLKFWTKNTNREFLVDKENILNKQNNNILNFIFILYVKGGILTVIL